MKTAVCLIVKNEAIELPYWLAWHKMIGFDSFLIFNDSSDDETEAVILSLKDFYDIRYQRNFLNRDRSNARQIRCYNAGLKLFGEEFDWIAFFDVDEYLDLKGERLINYLERFPPDVSQVTFNWCCVGTNGFVSRPEGPPFVNYTKHAAVGEFWNRHTKFIVKPANLRLLKHPHCAVAEGQTADASGNPPNWSNEHGGFTAGEPDWTHGRLFHYQSRSLEHYVKRHKNMEERRRNSGDPMHAVTHDPNYSQVPYELDPGYIEDYAELVRKASLAQIPAVNEILSDVPNDVITHVAQVYKGVPIPEFEAKFPGEKGQRLDIDLDRLGCPGVESWTFMDSASMSGFYTLENIINPYVKFDALFVKYSDYVHLIDVNIEGDHRVIQLQTYQVWQDERYNFCFSHPRTGRFLSLNTENMDNLVVNRERAHDWESFKIVSKAVDRENSYGPKLFALAEKFSIRRLLDCKEALPNGVASMPLHLRKALLLLSKGVLGEHLI